MLRHLILRRHASWIHNCEYISTTPSPPTEQFQYKKTLQSRPLMFLSFIKFVDRWNLGLSDFEMSGQAVG